MAHRKLGVTTSCSPPDYSPLISHGSLEGTAEQGAAHMFSTSLQGRALLGSAT